MGVFNTKGPGRKQCPSCHVYIGVRSLTCEACGHVFGEPKVKPSAPVPPVLTIGNVDPTTRAGMFANLMGIISAPLPEPTKPAPEDDWAVFTKNMAHTFRAARSGVSSDVPKPAGSGRGKRACPHCHGYNGVAVTTCNHCGGTIHRAVRWNASGNVSANAVNPPAAPAASDSGDIVLDMSDLLGGTSAPAPASVNVPAPARSETPPPNDLEVPYSKDERTIVNWARRVKIHRGEEISVEELLTKWCRGIYFRRSGSDPVLKSNVRAYLTRAREAINAPA